MVRAADLAWHDLSHLVAALGQPTVCRRSAPVGLATTVTIASLFNSLASGVERAIFERKANSFRLKRQPLFLIGHWRSGTTFLHELLAQDDQFYAPTTYQCMQPHHFLFTESWVKPVFSVLIPQSTPDGQDGGRF